MVVAKGTRLLRLYRPDLHSQTETSLRNYGPLRRFDHQRADADNAPRDDLERGIWYGGHTLSVCIVEVFGDIGVVALAPWRLAFPTLGRDIRLLDLRGGSAIRAGVTAELAKAPYGLSQAWSRYFYEHDEIYGAVDGAIYASAHNDEDSIALYERAARALICDPPCSTTLDDPALRDDILRICDYYGYEIEGS